MLLRERVDGRAGARLVSTVGLLLAIWGGAPGRSLAADGEDPLGQISTVSIANAQWSACVVQRLPATAVLALPPDALAASSQLPLTPEPKLDPLVETWLAERPWDDVEAFVVTLRE